MNSKIWKEGYDAYNDGLTPNDCPYPTDSDEHEEWMLGGLAAWNEYIDKALEGIYWSGSESKRNRQC